MTLQQFLFAFVLTSVAGLSTGLGGLFAFFTKRTNTKVLSIVLGFSAGVMIYVSLVELLNESRIFLETSLGQAKGSWLAIIGFFSGIALIAAIDRLVPSKENPHETPKFDNINICNIEQKKNKLLHTGLLTALAITIHNFPEGLASFTSAVKQPSLGIAIAMAIAIHNIPEGISVSIPVYCALGSKRKALILSLLSGLSEPIGAMVGYLVLMQFLNDVLYGILFAFVAGIMVFISLDELLPTAHEFGEHHLSMYGLVAGMAVMALSIQLF